MGLVILGGDVALRCIPVYIFFIMSTNMIFLMNEKWRKMFLLIYLCLSVLVNCLFYFLLHRILLQSWDVMETVHVINTFRFSYQDIAYLPVSVLICTVFSFIAGDFIKKITLLVLSEKCADKPLGYQREMGLLLSLSITGLVVIYSYYYMSQGIHQILINEVCSNNQSLTFEDAFLTPDYVEIYNSGFLDCELEQLYLSDDEQNLQKKEISSYVIPAGGFLVIELGDSSFSLRKNGGETLFLSDRAGNIIDQVILKATDADYAYARQEDGGEEWSFLTCTPGASNYYATKQVEVPVFSHESGFYSESFELTLTSEPGTVIYYTLDGSIPSNDTELYQGEILVYDKSHEANIYRSVPNVMDDWECYEVDETPVDKAFVVRAVAIDESGSCSKVATATYFIDMGEYQHNIVISLVADPEALFGDEGIYVTGQEYDEWYLGGKAGDAPVANYFEHGRETEIEASLELFSEERSFSQSVGLRVAGGASRYERPLKYFNLYARKEYSGNNVFKKNFFDGTASHKIMLRYGDANALCQMLVYDRNIGTQRAVRASVFLNGEFWYHANIMEKYDKLFFQGHYGIDEDNLIVVKQGSIEQGREEDMEYYFDLFGYINQNSLAEDSNYQILNEMIDMQSYIDFMCINFYIDNMDFTESKNVVLWRSREIDTGDYEDARWRWALYDLDAVEWDDAYLWGYSSQAEKNTFSINPRYTAKISEQKLYASMKVNADFCRQFVLTFMDLVNTNFKYENVEPKIQDYFNNINTEEDSGSARQYFEEFFRDRASIIVPYMAEEFGLTGSLEPVTLYSNMPEAGHLILNTIKPDLSKGSWCGEYYTDYSITVTATAGNGYEFVGWEGAVTSTDACIEVPVEVGGIDLHAIFKKAE